jgi:hypothetical protein
MSSRGRQPPVSIDGWSETAGLPNPGIAARGTRFFAQREPVKRHILTFTFVFSVVRSSSMAAFLRLVSKSDNRIHHLNLELIQRVEDRTRNGKRSLQLTMASGERISVHGKYARAVISWMGSQSIGRNDMASDTVPLRHGR